MRAGLVEQNDLIELTLNELQTKKVTAFVGAPLAGKSTFLEIIEDKLRPNGIPIIKFKVSVSTTASNLIRQITASLHSKVQPLEEELIVESLLRYLNENKAILLLDDLQNLIEASQFIEAMMDRLQDSRLIFSSTILPNISKDRVLELGIVRARSFNQAEVSRLVGGISIHATTSELLPAIERLHELSNGAPDLVKLTLGDIYVSGQSLTKLNIEKAFLSAQSEKLLRITEKISPETKQSLSTAAFVKFDARIENHIISSLPKETIDHLGALGLIKRIQDDLILEHKELWRSLSTDSQNIRRHILEIAKMFDGFLSIREQLYQLKDLKEWSELSRIFDETIIECETFWTHEEIETLTAEILEHIPTQAMGYRATALRAVGKGEQSLKELNEFLKKDLNEKDRRWIEYQILRSKMYSNNNRDNLQDGFLTLFKQSQPDERTYYRTLCYSLLFNSQTNGPFIHGIPELNGIKLEDLYLSTLALLKKYFSSDPAFIALSVNEFGLIFRKYGMLELRDRCFEDALKIVSNVNPTSFDALHVRLLVSESKNEAHIKINVRESLRIGEEAKMLGFDYLASGPTILASEYATAQGRPSLALSILNNYWKGDLEKIPFSLMHHTPPAIHAWILEGNPSEAYTFLRSKLSKLNPSSNNLVMYTLLRSRDCFDYLVSPDMKTQPTISADEVVNERNVHALANMLSLLDLHSYYQFDQIYDRVLSRVTWNNKAYLRAIGLTQPHYAWRELLAGRLKIADQHFTAAVELSRREEMYFYQFRSLSGMIVLALQEDQLSKARDLLSEAKTIAPLMDPVEGLPELHLLPILEALYLIRSNEKPAARTLLQTTKKFKRYEFLRLSLLNELGINAREEVYNPGAAEKKFSERLLELTKVKLQNRYEFRDHLATHSILEEMPKLRKGYDFVWNRVNGELLIGREKLDLQDKPLIEELLYFLVCHPNESYTKEQLIGFVWRETYNPLVHDSRIYTSVKRIRQMFASLGEKEVVIQDAGRYGLSREIKFAVISRAAQDLPILPRQKWVIEFVDQNGTIDRLTAEKVLDISAAQVKRDLKDLVDRGFLSIDGSGRAAKYIRGRTS